MNCWTNSIPYGYGGRMADMTVLPVRIIMSPTCSSRFLTGKNVLSATACKLGSSLREENGTRTPKAMRRSTQPLYPTRIGAPGWLKIRGVTKADRTLVGRERELTVLDSVLE